MEPIAQALGVIRQRIAVATAAAGRPPGSVALLAVSKTHGPERIVAAAAAGQGRFGENYVGEALAKMATLAIVPDLELEWHFIGHLQSNKSRAVAESFHWVHTVDSIKLARRLNTQRPASLPPLHVCLQVNVSGEASKAGIAVDHVFPLAAAVAELPRLRLRGLMAIPAVTTVATEQRTGFHRLAELAEELRGRGLPLDTLSMGMTGDLEAAIAEGATLVRVGTGIFGPRGNSPP